MWARAAIAFLISTAPAAAQDDPSLDRWLAGAPRADIRWFIHTSPAALSRFERLSARFSIRVNGSEIERRRGKGALLLIVQLCDSTGKKYETHHVLDLREATYKSARHLDYTEWSAPAFLTPGDYQATFAMADLTTGEHNLATRKLRVAPLSGDPLPDSWRNMPPVEFIESIEPPDIWFLPETRARLALPVVSKQPVHVDLLVNTAVSETSRAVQRRPQQSLGSLLGALKVLAQLDVPDGGLNIALIDITRRRTIFKQDSVAALDWPRLKSALGALNPSTIDVSALKNRDQDAQFFLHELSSRIAHPGDDGPLRVVIVLSPPMSFPSTADRTPLEAPAGSHYRLFYIRYQTFSRAIPISPGFAPSNGRHLETEQGPTAPGASYPGLMDHLAQTVKPLHPHLFDVFTPRDFRNAIATILREISTTN